MLGRLNIHVGEKCPLISTSRHTQKSIPIEIEVKENSIPEGVGRKFWIAADAAADGTTKHPLYDAEGQPAGVTVTVTAKA